MKYEIGSSASFSKTISESDVYMFAGLTGDMNNLHIDKVYAGTTAFGERIVHGMLVGSFISTVLGMKLPGCGSVYLEQKLEFCAPVKIGDTVTAKAEITEYLNKEKGIVKMNTEVFNQRHIVVIKGTAVVQVPEKVL